MYLSLKLLSQQSRVFFLCHEINSSSFKRDSLRSSENKNIDTIGGTFFPKNWNWLLARDENGVMKKKKRKKIKLQRRKLRRHGYETKHCHLLELTPSIAIETLGMSKEIPHYRITTFYITTICVIRETSKQNNQTHFKILNIKIWTTITAFSKS